MTGRCLLFFAKPRKHCPVDSCWLVRQVSPLQRKALVLRSMGTKHVILVLDGAVVPLLRTLKHGSSSGCDLVCLQLVFEREPPRLVRDLGQIFRMWPDQVLQRAPCRAANQSCLSIVKTILKHGFRFRSSVEFATIWQASELDCCNTLVFGLLQSMRFMQRVFLRKECQGRRMSVFACISSSSEYESRS